jgi:hypothetical protein
MATTTLTLTAAVRSHGGASSSVLPAAGIFRKPMAHRCMASV